MIIFGSTGDLARRYLWPAMFDNYAHKRSPVLRRCQLAVFGVSRSPITDEEQLWGHVTANVSCEEGKGIDFCEDQLFQFRKSSELVFVRADEHYRALSNKIEAFYVSRKLSEIGRIFYLSVPPSAYGGIVQNIHMHARPRQSIWLRIVLEKPFGHDLTSAKKLASDLSASLSEEEIFRVDHFLGKVGVEQILSFRHRNARYLSPIWNQEHIDRIEIMAKEKLDVKGRTSFYDKYGVIRDMLQNHLTEMLVRTVAELSSSDKDPSIFLQAKKKLLVKIYPPRPDDVILGQYDEYQSHVNEECDCAHDHCGSETPTFASAVLFIRDPDWIRVPIVLTSGKKLDTKSTLVRVVFKQGRFPISQHSAKSCLPEIIFLVYDDKLKTPGVLVSSPLLMLKWTSPFDGWLREMVAFSTSSPECQYAFFHPTEAPPSNAYISVIGALLDGRRDMFVDTESLFAAWQIWTPILRDIDKHRAEVTTLYSSSSDIGYDHWQTRLSLPKVRRSLTTCSVGELSTSLSSACTHGTFSAMFGFEMLIDSQHHVAMSVANAIYQAALRSIKERGSFHLALPGGSSPLGVFEVLVLRYASVFPWNSTHIWQTDERCVPQNTTDSNFKQLTEALLLYIPLPLLHVHPMPVALHLQPSCSPDDNSHTIYEATITNITGHGGSLDYIVLGVGKDGHVASIFPDKAVVEQNTSVSGMINVVTLADEYPVGVKRRLSMTFKVLSSARSIALLIMGEEKREVVGSLHHCFDGEPPLNDLLSEEKCNLPVARLLRMARKEQLTVFIDSDITDQDHV